MTNYNGKLQVPGDGGPEDERTIHCRHFAMQAVVDGPHALDTYRAGPDSIVSYFSGPQTGGLGMVEERYNSYMNQDEQTRHLVHTDRFGHWLERMSASLAPARDGGALITTPGHVLAVLVQVGAETGNQARITVTAFDPNETDAPQTLGTHQGGLHGTPTLVGAFPALASHRIADPLSGMVATAISSTPVMSSDRIEFLGLDDERTAEAVAASARNG